jgi:3',5'-nucleoside bisphosphate phosphatase
MQLKVKTFKADLHIHTVLSPCADLTMSPSQIIACALRRNLDLIAITDHNSTLHCKLTRKLGRKAGIEVLYGAEINTREELHCLVFFEDDDILDSFQTYIEEHITRVHNNPQLLGYQVLVDENELITGEVDYSLHAALDIGIDQLAEKVHSLGGLVMPSHIDRPRNSLTSQLGMVPAGLRCEAYELSKSTSRKDFQIHHPEVSGLIFVRNSDAHFPDQIGEKITMYVMEEPCLGEIQKALAGMEGRYIFSE